MAGAPPMNQCSPAIFLTPQTTITGSKTDYTKRFQKTPVLILSVIQIKLCISAIITQVICLYLFSSNQHYSYSQFFDVIGAGIWCGIIFGISGGFGVWAACRPANPSIITHMVFSIIAASFCIPLIVIASISVVIDSDSYHYNRNDDKYNILVAMHGIQIILALIQAGVSITSSVYDCRVVCCGQENHGTVYYAASGIGSNTNIGISTGQTQPGYITLPPNAITTIPMTSTQNMLPNATAAPTSSEDTSSVDAENLDVTKNIDSKANDMKYHRL